MNDLNPMPGLVAAATLSPKKVNQDAFALVRNTKIPLSGIVVADGLGSHFGAEVSSSLAVASIAQQLEMITQTAEISMNNLFRKAYHVIANYVAEHAADMPPDLDAKNSFGTTAVCAVETADDIILGYVGNGGLFHIRGDFSTFPESQLLP